MFHFCKNTVKKKKMPSLSKWLLLGQAMGMKRGLDVYNRAHKPARIRAPCSRSTRGFLPLPWPSVPTWARPCPLSSCKPLVSPAWMGPLLPALQDGPHQRVQPCTPSPREGHCHRCLILIPPEEGVYRSRILTWPFSILIPFTL